MSKLILTINIYDDSDPEVFGPLGKEDKLKGNNTEKEMLEQMNKEIVDGHIVKRIENIAVIVTNPCAWVKVGSRYYWRCTTP